MNQELYKALLEDCGLQGSQVEDWLRGPQEGLA